MWAAFTDAKNYRNEVHNVSILKWCEYINTGGNCYVMFGNVETGEAEGDGAWFAGSVDSADEPIIQWYESREDAYNADAETGFIREVRQSDGEWWFDDLWRDAFAYVMEHDPANLVAAWDAKKYFYMEV